MDRKKQLLEGLINSIQKGQADAVLYLSANYKGLVEATKPETKTETKPEKPKTKPDKPE